MEQKMSWIGVLMTVAHSAEQITRLVEREERERLNILVDERSFCASIVRRLRVAQGRAYPLIRVQLPLVVEGGEMLDDDEPVDYELLKSTEKVAHRSIFKSREEASGGVDLVPRSTSMKYQRIAAQRQVDWTVFEHRIRELRREFDRTGDERLLDEIDSLKRPRSAASVVPSPTKTTAAGSPISSPSRTDRVPSAAVDSPCSSSGPEPPARLDDPPEIRQIAKEEGFIRSTVVMEERSSRLLLSKRWSASLTNPDDEMLAHRRNVSAYQAELVRRESERLEEAKKAAAAEFASTAHRFRAIAAAQNQRAQMKKDFRDARLSVEEEEMHARFMLSQQENEVFCTGLFLRRFNSVAIATRGEEEVFRSHIVRNEQDEFCVVHSSVAALMRLLRTVLQHQRAVNTHYDTERSCIQPHSGAPAAVTVVEEVAVEEVAQEGGGDISLEGRAEALDAANKLANSIQEANATFLELSRMKYLRKGQD